MHRLHRTVAIALLATLASSCASAVGADAAATDAAATDAIRGDAASDIPVSADVLACGMIPDALRAFISTNRRCSVDSDCVTVSAPCAPEQHDCCVIYLSSTHDRTLWNGLYSAHMNCVSSMGCGCCAAIPAPPGCLNGQCGPRR